MSHSALIEIVLIAIGLSMDAFAVSITSGTLVKKMHLHHILRIALFFGLFQGIMPLIGWWGGSFFSERVSLYSDWIAFTLLVLIGGKMLKDAFSESDTASFNPLKVSILFSLAIATSIDALAVGITFSLLAITIWWAALIIGSITFCFSIVGVVLGQRIGEAFGNRVEIFGGLILIGIGVKVLF